MSASATQGGHKKLRSQDGRYWCQGAVTAFRGLWLVST